jgi:hypothetical protein
MLDVEVSYLERGVMYPRHLRARHLREEERVVLGVVLTLVDMQESKDRLAGHPWIFYGVAETDVKMVLVELEAALEVGFHQPSVSELVHRCRLFLESLLARPTRFLLRVVIILGRKVEERLNSSPSLMLRSRPDTPRSV